VLAGMTITVVCPDTDNCHSRSNRGKELFGVEARSVR
jgi:hypothetical protein